MDKTLYALKAETGDTLWIFKAKGAIASTPLVVDDLIYVGDFEHRFYAIDKNTQRATAIFEGENWFWNDATHANGVIYVGDLSGNFYALDAGTLRLRWRYPAEGSEESKNPIRSKAVIVNERIFVASRGGAVNALRLDGALDRTLSFAVEARVLAALGQGDGTVYVSDQDQRVHVRKAQAK
jgi:outer membrane protein assembly factor BamB